MGKEKTTTPKPQQGAVRVSLTFELPPTQVVRFEGPEQQFAFRFTEEPKELEWLHRLPSEAHGTVTYQQCSFASCVPCKTNSAAPHFRPIRVRTPSGSSFRLFAPAYHLKGVIEATCQTRDWSKIMELTFLIATVSENEIPPGIQIPYNYIVHALPPAAWDKSVEEFGVEIDRSWERFQAASKAQSGPLAVCEFLIPTYERNDKKKRYAKSTHDEIRRRITELFGGYSMLSDKPLLGAWRNEKGLIEQDHCWRYSVGVPPPRVAELKQLLGVLGHYLGQACVYCECGGVGELIDAVAPSKE